jgi:hypothetical protein
MICRIGKPAIISIFASPEWLPAAGPLDRKGGAYARARRVKAAPAMEKKFSMPRWPVSFCFTGGR